MTLPATNLPTRSCAPLPRGAALRGRRDDRRGRRPAPGRRLVPARRRHVVINSRHGRRWPTNLQRDPRVSIAITDPDQESWVGLTGTVEVVDDQEQAQADIAAMARRYHGDDSAEAKDVDRHVPDAAPGELPAPPDDDPRPRRGLTQMAMTMRFGAQLWSQRTTWPEFRDGALAAEANGWDSVWTWDHLLAIFGPWEQPILEGWSTLTAVGCGHEPRPARADGRRQHVPQPGRHDEAGDDARQRERRAGRAWDRRRLVRAGARGVRHPRLGLRLRRASRSARRSR